MAVYKGWNAKIYMASPQAGTFEIGYCESASVEITTGVEPYYQIGSRSPAVLVEGNQEVTGSISKAWIDTAYLALVTGTGSLDSFTLVFYADNVTDQPRVHCYLCKFETGSVDIPQDGFLTEDYDFRATSVAVMPTP